MSVNGHLTFKNISGNLKWSDIFEPKWFYPVLRLLQRMYFSLKKFSDFTPEFVEPRKNDFSKADLEISPKNRIQQAVKIKTDDELLCKSYDMLKGPSRLYKEYQIVTKPILSNSATNAIEFYLNDILKSIPHIWAHEDLFCTTYRQTETTRRTRRKFLTNLVGQLSNRR